MLPAPSAAAYQSRKCDTAARSPPSARWRQLVVPGRRLGHVRVEQLLPARAEAGRAEFDEVAALHRTNRCHDHPVCRSGGGEQLEAAGGRYSVAEGLARWNDLQPVLPASAQTPKRVAERRGGVARCRLG